MQTVVPAVIPHSVQHLAETLDELSFSHEFQIDIVDGTFASPASWPFAIDGRPQEASSLIAPFLIELDCMVADPHAVSEAWATIGVRRFVIHFESLPPDELIGVIGALRTEWDATVGVALQNDTPLHELTPLIPHIDFVQVMGIREIGAQGHAFDVRAVERITQLKQRQPNMLVQVDGSVNEATIERLARAGADRFAVGSAITHADNPQTAYEHLTARARGAGDTS